MTVRPERAPARHLAGRVGVLLLAFGVFIAVGWALGRLAVAVASPLDLRIVREVASGRTAWLIAAAHGLSFVGSGYFLFPIAAVGTVGLAVARRFVAAATLALGTAGAVAMSNLIKVFVGRPRSPLRHLEHVVTPSFPSGHATQSSAFYVAVLAALLAARPPRAVPRIAVALTVLVIAGVAASRVVLAVHYPSDVVAGAALGTSWTVCVGRVITQSA